MYKDPFEHVGPPPPDKARAGRMNADGISMFYGSIERETCLAELRPALGGEAGTIIIETTEPLRILDFTRMTKTYKHLSYFQQDFAEQAARFSFLRRLGQLISRPVVTGQEGEYLITQIMMEYLAHVHSMPFDGVLFASAQYAAGKNVILFARFVDGKPTFQVKYKEESITVFKTVQIEYKHQECRYLLGKDGLELDWFFEEDSD